MLSNSILISDYNRQIQTTQVCIQFSFVCRYRPFSVQCKVKLVNFEEKKFLLFGKRIKIRDAKFQFAFNVPFLIESFMTVTIQTWCLMRKSSLEH